MKEAGFTPLVQPQLNRDMPRLQTPVYSLKSLRQDRAQVFDSMRFHFLEVLAQRVDASSGKVKPILESKLQQALFDYGERFSKSRQEARSEQASLSVRYPELKKELRLFFSAGDFRSIRRLSLNMAIPTPSHPLAGLNQYIQTLTQGSGNTQPGSRQGGIKVAMRELKSVCTFREMWSKIAAVDDVDQAMARGPENAGPLNSHMLVLRSLALMRKLSPDYLRRFLSQVDTLLWLDQASQPAIPEKVKAQRRSSLKK